MPSSDMRRWTQLALGLLVMMTISSPQYVWTLFVHSFQAGTHSSLAAVQVTFTALVVLQTFFSPAQGYLIDRLGPKVMIAIGAALSGAGWAASAFATTLVGLYASYGLLCGLGTGIVYVGIIGLMVRWFPERRGFAAGVVAAGYGMGAVVTTFPISSMIASSGFRHTLLAFGLAFAAVGVLAALFLRTPVPGEAAVGSARAADGADPALDVAPGAMLRTKLFWLMFIMMTMMSTGGLMVAANFANFAHEFGVANQIVFGVAALPFALTFDRVTNGLTRPFFGFVSDRLGREETMAVAFCAEALAIALLLNFRHNAYAFALLSGVVFFAWGEIFSLFPSVLTDTFGPRHATTNYGFLYMAQGVGSLLGGPVAALLHDAAGGWVPVFAITIGLDFATACLAILVLRPLRRQWRATCSPLRGVAGQHA
ncbi:oxalate/formate MFS antiporter [Lichenicoccus sp.]|uniref:oxalate/formate MFS antiporter n=1 Tax=Lichenicoccus sp. TaxID=2781899 RepID=UPI003D0F4A26